MDIPNYSQYTAGIVLDVRHFHRLFIYIKTPFIVDFQECD